MRSCHWHRQDRWDHLATRLVPELVPEAFAEVLMLKTVPELTMKQA
jgi:hypothetical protein